MVVSWWGHLLRKEATGAIRHFECIPLFLLENLMNRGNRDGKFDLCYKKMLRKEKKSASQLNSERKKHFWSLVLTRHLPFIHSHNRIRNDGQREPLSGRASGPFRLLKPFNRQSDEFVRSGRIGKGAPEKWSAGISISLGWPVVTRSKKRTTWATICCLLINVSQFLDILWSLTAREL